MNNLSGAARRVTRNLDQFSVICVFGSVVGCVVLPLMVQSMESFIITFVVLFLTAKPLRGRLFPSANQPQEGERRRSRDRDDIKKSKKSSPKKKQTQVVTIGGGSEQMPRLKEDFQKQEQQRLEDRERRLEEKREKKARKREERLQRREEEKKEREKEDQLRRERQEARNQRKKEDKERKQKTASFEIPTRENIQAIVNGIRPIKRERKHSTSSSASSISAHSTSYHAPRFQQKNKNSAGQRHSAPFRAASDPEISMATRNSPTPVAKPWPTTLPSTTGSSHWYTDMANRSFPSLPVVSSTSSSMAAAQQQFTQPPPLFPPQPSYFTMYPLTNGPFQPSPPTAAMTVPGSNHQSNTCWSAPPTVMGAGSHQQQQVCEPPLHPHLAPQAAWLPVTGAHQIQQGGGIVSNNSGSGLRYFSPAPGTMALQQQQSRLLEIQRSRSGGHHGFPGTTTQCNGSLFYSNTSTGFGMNNSNTGIVDGRGTNCYSLFSSTGGVGDAMPFSTVGGSLLNLDTSTNHTRHQVVSTGSPLSVGSDVSDGQNSIGGGDQSDTVRQSGLHVETVGSADKGHGVSVGADGKQSYDEWPNL